jgi:hypothetical protein
MKHATQLIIYALFFAAGCIVCRSCGKGCPDVPARHTVTTVTDTIYDTVRIPEKVYVQRWSQRPADTVRVTDDQVLPTDCDTVRLYTETYSDSTYTLETDMAVRGFLKDFRYKLTLHPLDIPITHTRETITIHPPRRAIGPIVQADIFRQELAYGVQYRDKRLTVQGLYQPQVQGLVIGIGLEVARW